MNIQLTIALISLCGSLITAGLIPVLLKKMDKQQKRSDKIGLKRLQIEEADMRMTRADRILTRETAKAVQTGRSNGELTRALENFDRVLNELEEVRMMALNELKEDYRR